METTSNVLATRYASLAMRDIWSAEGRICLERDYWIAVLRAQKELGLEISQEVIEDYSAVKNQIYPDSIQVS